MSRAATFTLCLPLHLKRTPLRIFWQRNSSVYFRYCANQHDGAHALMFIGTATYVSTSNDHGSTAAVLTDDSTATAGMTTPTSITLSTPIVYAHTALVQPHDLNRLSCGEREGERKRGGMKGSQDRRGRAGRPGVLRVQRCWSASHHVPLSHEVRHLFTPPGCFCTPTSPPSQPGRRGHCHQLAGKKRELGDCWGHPERVLRAVP